MALTPARTFMIDAVISNGPKTNGDAAAATNPAHFAQNQSAHVPGIEKGIISMAGIDNPRPTSVSKIAITTFKL